ncbi:MAG: NIPSNAP family protein [Betaproteobacteria bacterium HGW-Betaproteobacteria-16]|nr:MAG: NIPSNAP family protein [Betaproteobacteria bacterium HGW-Betaproteobacteria-16]
MIHELRIYHCLPGRLSDVHTRFQSITLPLWEKHRIRPVGFWTVTVGPSNNDLYYLLEWKDLAERDRQWNAFSTDPDWVSARARTEENGPLVERIENMMLMPTSYSPIK